MLFELGYMTCPKLKDTENTQLFYSLSKNQFQYGNIIFLSNQQVAETYFPRRDGARYRLFSSVKPIILDGLDDIVFNNIVRICPEIKNIIFKKDDKWNRRSHGEIDAMIFDTLAMNLKKRNYKINIYGKIVTIHGLKFTTFHNFHPEQIIFPNIPILIHKCSLKQGIWSC